MLGALSHTAGSPVDDEATRATLIDKALHILTRIHTAFIAPESDASEFEQSRPESGDAALEDAQRRRMLHALLDLISLEGIYPSLSSGVGIPLQQRVISVLPAGVIAKQTQAPPSSVPRDEPLLGRIVGSLIGIVFDPRQSIQPVIRGRILSDIISGISDLAFNPNIRHSDDHDKYREAFAKIIDE